MRVSLATVATLGGVSMMSRSGGLRDRALVGRSSVTRFTWTRKYSFLEKKCSFHGRECFSKREIKSSYREKFSGFKARKQDIKSKSSCLMLSFPEINTVYHFLTQSSWMKASGRPSAAARKIRTTSPMLDEIR